jgi:hypothetical protein
MHGITAWVQRSVWILAVASALLCGTALRAQPHKSAVAAKDDAKKSGDAQKKSAVPAHDDAKKCCAAQKKTEPVHKTDENSPAPVEPVAPTWFTILFWIALFALYVGLIICAYIYRDDEHILKLKPSFFFWLGVFYLSLLLGVGVAYVANMYDLQGQFPDMIMGAIPIAVPWFGALGAVFLSLQAVFSRSSTWDPNYNHWHIARPLVGGIVGIVSFYLLVLINTASGAPPKMAADKEANRIIYYVAAFLVGYRERIFRDLLARATDLILAPGGVAVSAPAVSVKLGGTPQIEIPFDDTATAHSLRLEIVNSGSAILVAPRILVDTTSAAGAGAFAKINDLVSDCGDLGPSQSRTVEVQFTPVKGHACTGALTVISTSLPAVKIKLSGKGI